MMSTLELKHILIHHISSINDETFLNAIRKIIDVKHLQKNHPPKSKGIILVIWIPSGETSAITGITSTPAAKALRSVSA